LAASLPSVESGPARTVHLTKKEKIVERRESFLRSEPFELKFSYYDAIVLELGSSTHPSFSKSHARRIKRKTKEQLAGQSFSDLSSALASLEKDADGKDIDAESSTKDAATQIVSTRISPGIIGEGKPHPLSNHQRKCAL